MIERLVASRRYRNASDVQREWLQMIEGRKAEENAPLHALQEASRVGVNDCGAGRFRSFKSTAALKRRLTAIAEEAIATKPLWGNTLEVCTGGAAGRPA